MPVDVKSLLGKEAEYLLDHQSKTLTHELLHLPGPDFVDRVLLSNDRSATVLRNMQTLFGHG